MEYICALIIELFLLDIPDSPAIEAVQDGTPVWMMLGTAAAAAVLLYVFFRRNRKPNQSDR